jgi:hypothetical protein
MTAALVTAAACATITALFLAAGAWLCDHYTREPAHAPPPPTARFRGAWARLAPPRLLYRRGWDWRHLPRLAAPPARRRPTWTHNATAAGIARLTPPASPAAIPPTEPGEHDRPWALETGEFPKIIDAMGDT